jgi:hypothetical protein
MNRPPGYEERSIGILEGVEYFSTPDTPEEAAARSEMLSQLFERSFIRMAELDTKYSTVPAYLEWKAQDEELVTELVAKYKDTFKDTQ